MLESAIEPPTEEEVATTSPGSNAGVCPVYAAEHATDTDSSDGTMAPERLPLRRAGPMNVIGAIAEV
jgi:hypothetical protein